jgi:hypothetical protein
MGLEVFECAKLTPYPMNAGMNDLYGLKPYPMMWGWMKVNY